MSLLDSQDKRAAFLAGYAFTVNSLKASGQDVDVVKLYKFLKEVANKNVTLAVNSTELLLSLENARGTPFTADERKHISSLLSPQTQQDEISRESAELIVNLYKGLFRLSGDD